MSNLKFVHSGGNSVSLTTPDSNPAANRTFKLPGADGTAGQTLKTDASGGLSFTTTSKTTTPAFYVRGTPSVGTKDGLSNVFHSYTAAFVNNGTVWDNSNGRFTAPVTGLYQFGFTIFDGTSNGNIRNANLIAYDSSMNQLFTDDLVRESHENPSAGPTTFSSSVIAPLDATNRVYLTFTGTVQASTPRNVFYGYLIGH